MVYIQELKEEFKDFTKWWKKAIGDDKVSNVKVSNRLLSTPCVVVAGKCLFHFLPSSPSLGYSRAWPNP